MDDHDVPRCAYAYLGCLDFFFPSVFRAYGRTRPTHPLDAPELTGADEVTSQIWCSLPVSFSMIVSKTGPEQKLIIDRSTLPVLMKVYVHM